MAQVAIVGAGPAGMAAAISAVEAGCDVLLVDEYWQPGGQIYRQPAKGLAIPEFGAFPERRRKDLLLRSFEAIRSRIDYRPATTAHSLYPGPELQIATDTTSERLKPGAIVLATGVSERCVPLPGWTLPGVLYAGGLQALMKSSGVVPSGRIVVCGAGVLPLVVGAQVIQAGGDVAAIALLHPLSTLVTDPVGLLAGRSIVAQGLQLIWTLRKARVEILQGWAPTAIEGSDRVEAIVLAPVDADGRHHRDRSRRLQASSIAMNFGFNANSELARMAGAATRYDAVAGGWLPIVDREGRTSIDGVFVAGDSAGLRGAIVAEAEGHLAGAAAAAHALNRARTADPRWQRTRVRSERFQAALRRTLHLPPGVWSWARGDTVICRCENVTRTRLDVAVAEGHRTLDAIKRNTRTGMGWCGGRTCLQAVAACVGQTESEIAPMRARPVARPVKLGALANGERKP